MNGNNQQKEFDRAVERAMKKKARKQMFIWIVIILLISIILSFALYFMQNWYDQSSQGTGNLTDIEKQYRKLQKGPGKGGLDEFKKYDYLLKKLKEQ